MTDVPSPQASPTSPYEIMGRDKVHALAERFYGLMASDPAYASLRALHSADLTPMKRSLEGFLTGWLGGPKDWFEARPGVCMMSMHARVNVDRSTARQWLEAMSRALDAENVDAALGARIIEAFTNMAGAMVRRGTFA